MLDISSHTALVFLGAAAIDPPERLVPLAGALALAGFPSPAEDFLDDTIDLNAWLVDHPSASFYYRASGHSMILEGIAHDDVLLVDRSVEVMDDDLVLACWEGNAPLCKRLKLTPKGIELHSRNPHFAPIVLSPEIEVELFCITAVIRKVARGRNRVRAG